MTGLRAIGNRPAVDRLGLTSLDSENKLGALDVWFDSLLNADITLDTLLQKTAAVAQCSVGLQLANALDGRTAASDGTLSTGIPAAQATSRTLPAGAVVWLDRWGQDSTAELDARILDRLQVVIVMLLRQMSSEQRDLGQSALIEIAISATADAADRARALRRLGYDPSGELRVLAMGGRREAADRIIGQLRSDRRRAVYATIGNQGAILVHGPLPAVLDVPIGARVASGPSVKALDAPRSWQLALQTFRFTLPSSRSSGPYSPEEAVIVHSDEVGCLGLLARYIPVNAIEYADEIRGLDHLALEPGGPEMLRTLEVVAATESLRRAAGVMHMHHNSVRRRIERAGEVLGFNPIEPYGRIRLMMALILRRLRDAHSVTDDQS